MTTYCGARTKNDSTVGPAGTPCARPVANGNLRCGMHGGATPQSRRKAIERQSINTLMSRELTDEERRHPWQIAVDALQRLDDVMQHGEALDGVDYVSLLERVARAAKSIIDAGVGERLALAHERDLEAEGRFVVEAVAAAVDALLDLAAPASVDREAWRRYALTTAIATLHAQPPPAPPLRVIEAQVESETAQRPAPPADELDRELTAGEQVEYERLRVEHARLQRLARR